jgi:hypothetical protein
MGAIGGSIKNFSIKGRSFTVAADADANRDSGGYSTEVQPNGDGTARKVMTAKPWSIDGLTASIDDNRDDMKFLQDVADGKDAGDDGFYDCTVTEVNGATHQGRGTVTGDLKKSTKNSTCPVTLMGPDKLSKQ